MYGIIPQLISTKGIVNGRKEKKMGSAAAGKNHTGCYEKRRRVSTY